MTITLSTVFTLGALVSLGVVLVFHAATHRFLGQRRRRATGRVPISVLKPLRGAEPELYDNLVACARQDYPFFELVLGAEDPEDPALAVARKVAADHPAVSVTIVAGAPTPGLNPKVNMLAELCRHARFDLVVVSDADVRPAPEYLDALMAELEDPAVGLVSSVLVGTQERSVGAAWENLHLATLAGASVAAARQLAGHALVVGKSMAFRRSDLEALGGWPRVENVLAEDYLLGRAFAEAGWKVALSNLPVAVVNRRRSLTTFRKRHLRWNQMRCRIHPPAYLGELLLMPAPWVLAALTAAGFEAAPVTPKAALLVGVLVVKSLADGLLLARLRDGGFPSAAYWSPVKDLTAALLWPVGILRRRLDWRGHPLEIGAGSRLFRPAPGRGRRWSVQKPEEVRP
ncbi:MAG: glycosyltransferase [Thermoanaerobaculia bacterium]|nr:glycosyltransferase [Thermoanaerobaculia bacterium]